jgi:hypothetical protein
MEFNDIFASILVVVRGDTVKEECHEYAVSGYLNPGHSFGRGSTQYYVVYLLLGWSEFVDDEEFGKDRSWVLFVNNFIR